MTWFVSEAVQAAEYKFQVLLQFPQLETLKEFQQATSVEQVLRLVHDRTGKYPKLSEFYQSNQSNRFEKNYFGSDPFGDELGLGASETILTRDGE